MEHCTDLESADYDAIILVAPHHQDAHEQLKAPLSAYFQLDASAAKGCCLVATTLPAKRLVYSSTGPLDRDYDDLRRFSDAAAAGVKRALSAGARRPLLLTQGAVKPAGSTAEAQLASLLGALAALYVPLEMREAVKEKAAKADYLGWAGDKALMATAAAIEAGRIVARDIGGSDPERMAAPRVEEYVTQAFQGTRVTMEVVKGQATFEAEFPCLAAVNRAAESVERHAGRLIWLTYKPLGEVKKTVYLVGKGITYDTGGADIKAGGHMAGMSRDKCGAAAAAGFMKTVAELQPEGVKVVAALCMVRNSVGENSYVADEIITSRAGVRLRVGNTDAEGRMAMVDVLCKCKEMALSEPDPELFTIATLTGHACLAAGAYSIVMENGPARQAGLAGHLQQAGDAVADMFEISTIRREDWNWIEDKSGEFVSVLQCNNEPSVRTARGHQIPGAFLQRVSGLDKHQICSEKPLKYAHIDIAASAGDLPDPTTGAPVAALVKYLLL